MRKPLTDEQKAAKRAYDKARRLANHEKITAQDRARYAANPEKFAARNKAWRIANPEKKAKGNRIWSDANPEKVTESQRKWAEANPGIASERTKAWRLSNSERAAESVRKWNAENPDKVNAHSARRRATKLQATPAWADDFVLSEAYELAQLRTRATGVIHHVDHIVPLKSKNVCGLHCEFNLRVIPGKENQMKSNTHWPDMPC